MTPISDLKLDRPTELALRHENITTVEQVLTMKRIDFLRVRGVGAKRADDIVKAIEVYKSAAAG